MRSPLYVVAQGTRLGREGRRLVVSKAGDVLARVPPIQVNQVIVFGNSQNTIPALHPLIQEGVEVVLLSQAGQFYGRHTCAESGHGSLRVAYILRSRDPAFALATAQAIVTGKLHNLRVQPHRRRGPGHGTLLWRVEESADSPLAL